MRRRASAHVMAGKHRLHCQLLVNVLGKCRTELLEFTERQLARVIDRIATNAELPAPYVAAELMRLRQEGGS